MATRFFVNAQGDYIGGFDGAPPPAGALEVPIAPDHAAQKWTGAAWGPAPAPEVAPIDALAAALIKKGVVSAAEIDAEKVKK